jgi:hypothetical protein
VAHDCDRNQSGPRTGRPRRPDDQHPEIDAVLEHTTVLTAAGERDLVTGPKRAPATVSLRDYLAMTLRFLDQVQPR